MYRYSRLLDVAQVQRDLRRDERFDVVLRFWSRWGDPALAGVLLGLVAWALAHGHTS
ncbi:MAG: hypothetical protein OXH70_11745 [Acidobacteria bacterium]|nr:hypothetical protein [Acidobacteriota bacterium]